MKIRIKTKDTSLSIDGFNGNIQEIIDLYKEVSYSPAVVYEKQEAIKHIDELKKSAEKQHEAPIAIKEKSPIRDRLPNNIVDVKDLDVQKAITENVLVRCPNCGQAYAIIVKDGNNLFLMRRDFEANEFVIVADADESQITSLIADDNFKEYYETIYDMAVIDSSDFAVNNDTEIFCPICHESNDFYKWKDAFQNPSKFFDYENVCDVCGGELSEIIDNKTQGVMVCNECGRKTNEN